MFYYIFACDKSRITNPKSTVSRYHPTLNNQIQKGDNGYIVLDYGYELIKADNIQDLEAKKSSLGYKEVLFTVATTRDDSELNSIQGFVRGTKTYVCSDENTFKSPSCEVYIDSLKGFSVLEKAKSYGFDYIMLDYILMRAYIQAIEDYQEKAAASLDKNETEILEKIYRFDVQSYFATPMLLKAYQGYQIWQKLAKVTGLKDRHDEMLAQVERLASLVEQKRAKEENENAIKRSEKLSKIGISIAVFAAILALVSAADAVISMLKFAKGL